MPTKPRKPKAETLKSQVDRLAKFIVAEIPGEPSQSEGAVDTAIRLLRTQQADLTSHEETIRRVEQANADLRRQLEGIRGEVRRQLAAADKAAQAVEAGRPWWRRIFRRGGES